MRALVPAALVFAGGIRAAAAGGEVRLPVVGGNPAALGTWNDAAAVFFDDNAGCTGTLIAPDVVLTAGHCIGGVNGVVLGSVDLREEDGEAIGVVEEIEYPDSLFTYDLGLLILARPSQYTPRVIATGCVLERYLADGAPVEIVGWGAVDSAGSQVTGLLMEAESTVTDFDCTGGRGCNEEVIPGGELGAGGNNVDACFGDSGGPLYLLTEIGEFLVGVTSRGYIDTELPCGEGGIYVRPDAVIDWIEKESGRSIPRATCNARPVPTADATALEVEAGESVGAMVSPNDPDPGDAHTYEVGSQPAHGEATIDTDGVVRYTADGDYGGADRFTVRVADNGIPSLSAEVSFDVTVFGGDGGCGCRASEPPAAGLTIAAAFLAFLIRGRRRRPRG